MSEPTIRAAPVARRLTSLDALRGFDMFWIVGADALGGAFRNLDGGPAAHVLGEQLEHSAWEGFTFYDLIFPLFIFMVGVAITFSLPRIVANEGRSAAVMRVLRRSLLMYVLGLVYYGGFITPPIGEFRLMGILQRLAVCYAATGLLFIFFRPRVLVGVCVALLLGYWALLEWVPVPGFGAGDLAEGRNLTNWMDREFLWGRKWNGDHDPEGLLSNLPAIASCLLGVFAGLWLNGENRSDRDRVVWLAGAGVALIVAGHLWSIQFPVIKKLWTSSYVLLAGGWSALLLAIFHQVIDVWKHGRWAQPFVWIGTNALTIYLVCRLVDFGDLSARLAGGVVSIQLDRFMAGLGGLLQALIGIALSVAVCRFLYQKKVFLRL